MIALITNKNNPSVKKVTGIVSNTKIGFKNVFKRPKTTATNNAPVKSVTWTPGKK